MSIINKIEPSEVLFVDRTGNMLIIYCKDDTRIIKNYQNIHQASKKLTEYRKKFENKRVG